MEKIESFYYRTDIIYTMPGKGDEITIWTENSKQQVCKHYLAMFLREAYAFYLGSYINEDEKCSFSTFRNLQPKIVLLMGNSTFHQCKCQIHENLSLKLKATSLTYDSSWWENVLWNTLPNNDCWKNECEICMDGKNFVPSKSLSAITSYNQWEDIEVPSTKSKMNESDEAKTYTKMVITTKTVQVGEVLDEFQETFAKVKQHQNTK